MRQRMSVDETQPADAAEMIVVGIDPGLSGGLVALTLKGEPVRGIVMPARKIPGGNEVIVTEVAEFFRNLNLSKIGMVAIEKVGAMPRDSKVGAFRFGLYFGKVVAVVEMLGLPFELVTPQAWQKAVLAGTRTKGKGDGITFVRRRFPTLNLKPSSRCKKDHDGISDAACIAEWARRRITGRD